MTVQDTLPYKSTYNNILPEIFSVPETLFKRTLHLALPRFPKFSKSKLISNFYNYFTPNQHLFNKSVSTWKQKNSQTIITAYKEKKNPVIKLPFQNLRLNDAIQKGYIKIQDNNGNVTVSIPFHETKKIDVSFILKDLIPELTSTLFVCITTLLLASLNLNRNIYVALQCATLIGLVKGISKFACGNCTLRNTPWKATVEIFTETATEIFLALTGKKLTAFEANALKGLFRHSFDQFVGGYYDVMNATTASLDIIKSGFKGFSKAYFGNLLMNQTILGSTFGNILGAAISVTLINIFIDHCTL